MVDPYASTGLNMYDIRHKCDNVTDSSACYIQEMWYSAFLNQPHVKEAIGSEVAEFVECSTQVNFEFLADGDIGKPYHYHVANLLENGVPVLIYAGDKDYVCNWLGNQAWLNALEWSGQDGFNDAKLHSWDVDGVAAGEAKNFGPLTFLRVYDAGHMVPFNQPKNSLEMLNRWISGDVRFE
jgi:cathepsin A (carboxypeptidase C)